MLKNSKYRFFTLWICCWLIAFTVQAQSSAKKLKKEGLEYYDHAKYQEALNMLTKYQRIKPGDQDVRYKSGVSYYFTNDLENAKKNLHYVIENDKKVDPQAYYYLGRSYHGAHEFETAIKFYKQYLRLTKSNNSDRNSVKDAILRCAAGMRVNRQDELAIVENLGEEVNSAGDDFGPVPSPNYDDKIYFTSSRKGNIGGLRDQNGLRDDKFGEYNTDIYSTVIINGRWSATSPLNSLLNSPRHDVVLDYNETGAVMYFFKGSNLFSGHIMVDTFSKDDEQKSLFPDIFVSPINAEKGDCNPFFFNDTTVLFSSQRSGGYGGFDLYITRHRQGSWTTPQNLGPAINSAYDEVSPFLAKDGRTLYFSSNNLNSIGGLDIFKSAFNDQKQQWEKPKNLGLPVNSGTDDAHFRLSNDGLKGYFSSSRKNGFGKRDIFTAYFKTQQREQLQVSRPTLFLDASPGQFVSLKDSDYYESNSNTSSPSSPDRNVEIKQYEFPPLYYSSDDDVLGSSNVRVLNQITALMQQYPQLNIALRSHADESGPLEFSIYFSIKRAEKAANYLIENGIDAAKVHMQGLGPTYPIAMNYIGGEASVQGQRYNRRIEMELINLDGLPIQISYKMPVLGTFSSELGGYFRQAIQGLSYKIQVASIKQMYNSEIFLSYPDPMVEKSSDSENYRYSVGLYKTFASAEQLLKELKNRGIQDAFVVPYINGQRISRSEAIKMTTEYRDLLEFLSAIN